MKGYDACVFPREGEPVLICLEASAADAARPRGPGRAALRRLRRERSAAAGAARARARGAGARDYGRVGDRAERGTQASDRMVGEPTTFGRAWFDAFPGPPMRRPCSRRALTQDGPGGRAHAARQRDRGGGDGAHARGPAPGHDVPRRPRVAGVRARRRHGLEREGRAGAAVLADLVGPSIRTFTATSAAPVQEGEPTLFEIWVCADGYWAVTQEPPSAAS